MSFTATNITDSIASGLSIDTVVHAADSIASGLSIDTVVHAADSITVIIDSTVIETVINNTQNHSNDFNIGIVIAFIGFLIFAAHLFTEIFSRKRIPDVLLLMIIGLFLGPIFHIIDAEKMGSIGSIFSQITLIVLLFESGTKLSFNTLINSLKGTTMLTLINFFVTFFVIGISGWCILKLNPAVSFMLGAILGGTSSAVIIPIVGKINISEKSKTILILESAFSDVLCIVFALAILESLNVGKLQVGSIFGQVFSSFVLATLIGLAAALFWTMILDKIRHIDNSIFTTPAFVFIIYGINEILGYSGAIAALAFGIGIANAYDVFNLFNKNENRKPKWLKKMPTVLNETEKTLFSELVFLMKTFFFIYIGVSIQLNNIASILTGLAIAILIFILRIPIVRISIPSKSTDINDTDLVYMSVLVPKGLAAAVLAIVVSQTMLPGTENVSNIVFSVILFSITFSSILIPLVERSAFVKDTYIKMLNCLNFEKNKKNNNTKDNEQKESSKNKHTKKNMSQIKKETNENNQITAETENDSKDKR